MINCIYIHIPFCEKKCNYCCFCSFNLLSKKEDYINSLLKEIKFYYDKTPLKTLYFGGGTPFLLEVKDFEKILSEFNFNKETEITVELNPNASDFNKLKELKNLGINRLSVGIQNFNDKILKIIGRNHTKNEIYNCIKNINRAGFENFSVDLMYGLPNQDIKQWIETLDEAKKLEPGHISLYGLKIEKGTFFYKYPPKNLPNLDTQAKMYEIAIEKLSEEFLHYEFSSFAKNKNYISKHNSSYWKRVSYWGFGLSASGFIDNKRYTNTFNFKDYIKNPTQKTYQTLTKQEQIEEEIFLGLRLNSGIDFDFINKKYNIDVFKKYECLFNKFSKNGFMEYTNNGIKLTKEGILVSNEILCEFIEI